MTTNSIYFIDSRVPDYQRLIAALPADSKAFLLNPDQDGIEQMRTILSSCSELDSIQVISHGTQGALYLGNTVLTHGNIDQYRNELGEIGGCLTADGDLLLYGCHVAQGEQGRRFIEQLAQFTGADVAASDDLTGSAALGGDWELEATTGVIETAPQSLAYQGVLGLVVSPNIQSYPGSTLGEKGNTAAFAVIKTDGSVVTWGVADWGGDSSAVASQLNGTVDVTQIFSTGAAFAALRADGSVVTWGNAVWGSDSSAVASQLDGTVDVTQIYSTGGAFAALRADGSVVTWGNYSYGGNSSAVASQLNGTVDVTQIYSTEYAFAALRADGSVVTWGNYSSGGNSSAVASQLNGTVDVTQIYSTWDAFAALRADGSVVTWGGGDWGGDSSAVASQLNGTVDVTHIFSTGGAFAALRADGSVVTWGYADYGGDSSRVADKLDGTVDITQIYSNDTAFAALRADGSVLTWGYDIDGGNSSAVASQLNGTVDVTQIYSTWGAFAALRADGSVVTWGNAVWVSDSSAVASQLDGTVDVTQIFSTGGAFAALRADGSVVTWGHADYGGDSSRVADKLDGTVDITQIFSTGRAFAALRADGSVVTWGYDIDGGDSSAVASQLSSGVVSFANIYTDDFYTADPVWQISPDAVVKSEADGSIQFTITRPDDRLAIAETVYISTTRNHGSDNVGDYTGLESQPYTFGVGDKTSTPITVNILSDSIAEPDETFGLIVQDVLTDELTPFLASTTFTIQDSVVTPPGEWRITPDDTVASEADGKIEFTITRPDDRLDIAETVYISTNGIDGSSNDGDFIGSNSTYTFAVGEKTSAPMAIHILSDILVEDDETFGLTVKANSSDIDSFASMRFTIQDPPIPEKPTELELEYIAKSLVYDGRLADEDRRAEILSESRWESLGYQTIDIFINGTFLAIGLKGINKEPVLAIRGTVTELSITSVFDWVKNFQPSGVGYTEFYEAWKDDTLGLRDWLVNNPGANITGHSQAGGQAQLLAAAATSEGIEIGNVLTFNSPGIIEDEKNKFNPKLAGDVKHIVSSGDIVQLAGQSFIPGDVFRYNFENNRGTKFPFDMLISAHMGHWAKPALYGSSLDDGRPPVNGYDDTGNLTLNEYESEFFSYLYSGDRFDGEYFHLLMATSLVLPHGPELAAAMSTRGTVSVAHKLISALFNPLLSTIELGKDIMQIIETAAQAMLDLGRVAWEAVSKWSASAWESIKNWTIETWQKAANWTADVWKATVNGVKSFFNDLKEKSADAINDLVAKFESTIDSIEEITVDTWVSFKDSFEASSIGWEFLSKSKSVEVVVSEHGVATAIPEASTVFFGIETAETFIGGGSSDVYLGGGGGDTYYLWGTKTSTEPVLRSLRSTESIDVFLVDKDSSQNILFQGSDIIAGTAADLDGDTVYGFANDDAIFVAGEFFTQSDLFVSKGSAILQADVNQDGEKDFTLSLKGEYELDKFVVENQETGTVIRYAGYLGPVLNDDGGVGFVTDSKSPLITMDVRSNDSAYDGGSIIITGYDDSQLTGLLTYLGGGQFSYAPSGAFDSLKRDEEAIETFTYTAKDATGIESHASVQIKVIGVGDETEILGTIRSETLNGTAGDDRIRGNDGNDVLKGGAGNDWLAGERGSDILLGGLGKDVFFFSKGGGGDTISDFTNGFDKIQIAADTGITSFGQLKIAGGGGKGFVYTTFGLGNDTQVVLNGVPSTVLDATDFIFTA